MDERTYCRNLGHSCVGKSAEWIAEILRIERHQARDQGKADCAPLIDEWRTLALQHEDAHTQGYREGAAIAAEVLKDMIRRAITHLESGEIDWALGLLKKSLQNTSDTGPAA